MGLLKINLKEKNMKGKIKKIINSIEIENDILKINKISY